MQPGTFRAVLYGVFIVAHKKGGYPEIGRKGHLLRKTQSGYIGTGHCTKNRAFGILEEELGNKIQQFRISLVIVL